MDLTNNALGRALGRNATSREQVELAALNNLPWASVMHKRMGFGERR